MNITNFMNVFNGFACFEIFQETVNSNSKEDIFAVGGGANLNAIQRAALVLALAEKINILSKGRFVGAISYKKSFLIGAPVIFSFSISNYFLNLLYTKKKWLFVGNIAKVNRYLHIQAIYVLSWSLTLLQCIPLCLDKSTFFLTTLFGCLFFFNLNERLYCLPIIKQLCSLYDNKHVQVIRHIALVGWFVLFGSPFEKISIFLSLFEFLLEKCCSTSFEDKKLSNYNDKIMYSTITTIEEFLAACSCLCDWHFTVNREHVWVEPFYKNVTNFDLLSKFVTGYSWPERSEEMLRIAFKENETFDGAGVAEMAVTEISFEELKKKAVRAILDQIESIKIQSTVLGGSGINYQALQAMLGMIQDFLPLAPSDIQRSVMNELGSMGAKRCALGVASCVRTSLDLVLRNISEEGLSLCKNSSFLPPLIFHHLRLKREKIINTYHYYIQTPMGVSELSGKTISSGLSEKTLFIDGIYKTVHGVHQTKVLFGNEFGVLQHEDVTFTFNGLFRWLYEHSPFGRKGLLVIKEGLWEKSGLFDIKGYHRDRIIKVATRVMQESPIGSFGSINFLRDWAKNSDSSNEVKEQFEDLLAGLNSEFNEKFLGTEITIDPATGIEINKEIVQHSFVCAVLLAMGVLKLRSKDEEEMFKKEILKCQKRLAKGWK